MNLPLTFDKIDLGAEPRGSDDIVRCELDEQLVFGRRNGTRKRGATELR